MVIGYRGAEGVGVPGVGGWELIVNGDRTDRTGRVVTVIYSVGW